MTAVATAPGFAEADVLPLVAGLERASEHPLSQAIVRGMEDRGLREVRAEQFTSVAGKGVRGTVAGRTVVVGSARMLEESGVSTAALQDRAAALRGEGKTVVFAAIDGRLAAVLGIEDPVKASTGEAIRALREAGVQLRMITGDDRATAESIARRVGLQDVEAEVLPQDKAEAVRRAQRAGARVAMVGDGVNDAPALAQADVGIAMGTGADVAMESAGITLLRGDLRGVVRARRLSRHTMRNIRQNLFWAFLYNTLGVPVAAGVLYPAFGLLLDPVLAGAVMTLLGHRDRQRAAAAPRPPLMPPGESDARARSACMLRNREEGKGPWRAREPAVAST